MALEAAAVFGTLFVVGFVPTYSIAGAQLATWFVAPITGAVLAGMAAEMELATAGTILPWFVVLSLLTNSLAAVYLIRRRVQGARSQEATSKLRMIWGQMRWSVVMFAVLVGSFVWLLQPIASPFIQRDGYAIWTLHAVFFYMGHAGMLHNLTNPAFAYSNQDYPPLVSAAGALAFAINGHVNLWLATVITGLLNASALGALACGIRKCIGPGAATSTRVAASTLAVSICFIGFGVSGAFAVGGYADLLWAATAVSAVVWSLVLPRSPTNLGVAWILGVAASLTKNEGFATALVIFTLISLRYVAAPKIRAQTGLDRDSVGSENPRGSSLSSSGGRLSALGSFGWVWLRCLGMVVLMAAPGLLWLALVRIDGIRDRFFSSPSTESLSARVHPTLTSVATDLKILPVAALTLALAAVVFRDRRARMGLANPSWLWVVFGASTAILVATYVLGHYEIHWWLSSSVSRTTIFGQLILYTDLAIWGVVAVSAPAPKLARSSDGAPVVSSSVRQTKGFEIPADVHQLTQPLPGR